MGILTFLQSKRYCTAEKISDKFNISIRTVYRDVKALNEIGVPVNFEVSKGYNIARGYFLPPLSFTSEEANALIILSTLADKFSDNSIIQHSNSALDKIKAVLRHSESEKAAQLSPNIKAYISKDEKKQPGWLTSIQRAIVNKTVLKIEYTDNKGKQTKREIEAVGLIFYTYQWHLYAWCKQRKGYRDFKVGMITSLIDTEIGHSINEHRKLEDYVGSFK